MVSTQKHIVEMVIGHSGIQPFASVTFYKKTLQTEAEHFYFSTAEEGRPLEIFNETDRARTITARFDSNKLFLYMRPTGSLKSTVSFKCKDTGFYGEFDFLFEENQESFTSVTALSENQRNFQMNTIYSVEVSGPYKFERDFEDKCRPGRCSGIVERQIAAYPYFTTWERAFASTHDGKRR